MTTDQLHTDASELRTTDEDVAAFVENFKRAHESSSADQLAELFHDDAIVHYPMTDAPLDKAGVRAFWQMVHQSHPHLKIRPLAWAANGNVVFIEWKAQTLREESPLTWWGVDKFVLRGLLACWEANYWDTAVLTAGGGGSRAEQEASC